MIWSRRFIIFGIFIVAMVATKFLGIFGYLIIFALLGYLVLYRRDLTHHLLAGIRREHIINTLIAALIVSLVISIMQGASLKKDVKDMALKKAGNSSQVNKSELNKRLSIRERKTDIGVNEQTQQGTITTNPKGNPPPPKTRDSSARKEQQLQKTVSSTTSLPRTTPPHTTSSTPQPNTIPPSTTPTTIQEPPAAPPATPPTTSRELPVPTTTITLPPVDSGTQTETP